MKTDLKKSLQSLLLSSGVGARVAVLDSGVNPKFPLLRGRQTRVYDCTLQDTALRVAPLPAAQNNDRNGHGSYVHSCIAAVAPDAQIDHFRILDENNQGNSTLLCYVLDHIIEQRYHVVNLSLGTRNEDHLPWLVSIMKRAYENDIAIVAACSNVGNSLYPARFTYCISVDAMAAQHPLQVRFKRNSVVEFAALGVNVPVIGPGDAPKTVTGSSYAAGHISGLCARIVEIQGRCSPLDMKILLREYAQSLERDVS